MIKLVDVNKRFGNLQALKKVNVTIEDGEIFGIVGQSGAGKSTLLRTINQLEKIDTGSIEIDGVDVTKLNDKELREFRKEIGMIFQHFSLLEMKTVYKNIALPLECRGVDKKECGFAVGIRSPCV